MTQTPIDQIKEKMIHLTLLAIILMILPALVNIILRSIRYGSTPMTFLVPILAILYFTLFFLKHKVPYRWKLSALFFGIILVNISGYFAYGLMSMGLAHLMTINVMSALYFNRKNQYRMLAYTMMTMVIFAMLYTTRTIRARYDLTDFYYGVGAWGTQVFSMMIFTLIVVFSVRYMMESLKVAIETEEIQKKEMEEMMRTENERLEDLVALKSKELASSQETLIQKERLASLGSLVAGVSHEVNTPLGVAITASSYLIYENEKAYKALQDGKMSKHDLIDYMKKVDETSQILDKNLNRAAELLKSFKSISVNQTYDYLSTFEISELINALILTLRHEFKGTGHKILVQIKQPIIFHSYASAYTQIFTNLILNSLTHGFKNMINGVIEITYEDHEDQHWFIYKDTGVGIDPETRPLIFDPFFTTNRGGGGSGLGLSVVYNLVTDRLKGSINCESDPLKGTTFIIRIPKEDSANV